MEVKVKKTDMHTRAGGALLPRAYQALRPLSRVGSPRHWNFKMHLLPHFFIPLEKKHISRIGISFSIESTFLAIHYM
jgi:hypothetical protein